MRSLTIGVAVLALAMLVSTAMSQATSFNWSNNTASPSLDLSSSSSTGVATGASATLLSSSSSSSRARSRPSSSSSSSSAMIVPVVKPVFNPSNGQPPVITKVSGCTDIGPVTMDCVRPVQLTIYGSGFMTGLEYQRYALSYLVINIQRPNTTGTMLSYDCVTDWQSNYTDTQFQCVVGNYGYGYYDTDKLLFVTLYNTRTRNSSAPFPGVAFKYQSPPRIDAISGCNSTSADGQIVYGCQPDLHSITLTGSGFSAMNGTSVSLQLDNNRWTEYVSNRYQSTFDITQYSDTTVVFSLLANYHWLLSLSHYGSLPLAFNMTDAYKRWSSNTVYIQFAPLPLPNVTGITTYTSGSTANCLWNNVSNVYENCLQGATSLTLTGSYLYVPLIATIGGVNVSFSGNYYASGRNVWMTLPLYPFVTNLPYDLTLTTLGGTLTLPSIVAFDSKPSIAYIKPCTDFGATWSNPPMKCFAGDALTMTVYNFNTSTVPSVQVRDTYNASQPSIELAGCYYVDANTLTCFVPSQPQSPVGQYNYVTMNAVWPDDTTSNNVTYVALWDNVNAPRVSAISGCQSSTNDALRLNQCLGGDILTVTGERLSGFIWTVWIRGSSQYVQCGNTVASNDSTMTCELPIVDLVAALAFDTEYSVYLYNWSSTLSTSLNSNAFYVTFVQGVEYVNITGNINIDTSTVSSPSSSHTVTVVLSTVLTIAGVAALALLAVFMHKLWLAKKSQRESQAQTQSEAPDALLPTGDAVDSSVYESSVSYGDTAVELSTIS